MMRRSTVREIAVAALFLCGWNAVAQDGSPNRSTDGYKLKLAVDEVVLTFHAADANGLPINDLKRDEIKLRDNGLSPRRIVAFDALTNRPLRAGILLDTSESMDQTFSRNKTVAEQYMQHLFRQQFDAAFVTDFAYTSEVAQAWTNDASLLGRNIRNVKEGRMNPSGGTALFDAIFRACFYEFGKLDPTTTGNFILLFSDGEDTAGQVSIDQALSACQRSNTAIYAFYVPPAAGHTSTGPKNLRELASRTGGRLFPIDETEDAIWSHLKTIEGEMRNQYRLVYNPADLKHDGSFHSIDLQPPDRVSTIEVRSGYYAPLP